MNGLGSRVVIFGVILVITLGVWLVTGILSGSITNESNLIALGAATVISLLGGEVVAWIKKRYIEKPRQEQTKRDAEEEKLRIINHLIASIRPWRDDNQKLVDQIFDLIGPGGTLPTKDFNGIYLKHGGLPQGYDYYQIDLHLAKFHECDMQNLTFMDANLQAVDARGTNFKYAILSGSNLSQSWLHDTDFSGARLTNCNLSYAILRNANLSGADLRGSNLTGAYTEGVKCNEWTFMPDGTKWHPEVNWEMFTGPQKGDPLDMEWPTTNQARS